MSGRKHRSGEPPADIEVGVAARARRLRFRTKPRTETRAYGQTKVRSEDGWEEIEWDSGSESERRNLPEEVEPGRTYRDVEVGWSAHARAEEPERLEGEPHRGSGKRRRGKPRRGGKSKRD